MSDNLFEQPPNATPLGSDEIANLRVAAVSRAQLNELESTNVAKGRRWGMNSRKDCFTPVFLTGLHSRMFSSVWSWAGRYRTHEVNIGNTKPHEIEVAVHQAFNDAKAWIEYKAYEPAELALRLHHRLVLVHPFVNGNGRSTRLIADIAGKRLGAKPFTWGAVSLAETSAARTAYVDALKAADNHDIEPLIKFAQS
jgi:Fic-DOC domain mobile mystery protein B